MNPNEILQEAVKAFAPPPPLTVSEWADKYRYVSIGPKQGQWRTDATPDLKEPMDCVTDPLVEGIVIVKPTRIGGTDGPINNPIGYHIHYDPCDILYAQSSKDQGELYSDSILMPMLRDTPVLAERLVHEAGRKATQTKTKKHFVGGTALRIIGAKSPKGFQAIQARLAIGDDLDEWEVSKYGDPVQKLIDRTKGIWNRKIILVSYPTHELTSRIWAAYKNTDMRLRWVPCPLCDEWQVLRFGGKDKDYGLKWKERTDEVYYLCEHCHEEIAEYHKDGMNTLGEWRAEGKFSGWAGFKLNPFLRSWHRWAEIRDTFLMAGDNPDKLMVFVNQTLGEVWKERGGLKIDEHIIFDRAQKDVYRAEVLSFAKVLTMGVDVQDDRIECEVYGWGQGEESCSVEVKIIHGSFASQKVQDALDNYRLKTFKNENGLDMSIDMTTIDSGGHLTAYVYEYTKSREGQNVYAVHGSNDPKADILDGILRVNKATGAKYQRVGVTTCKDVYFERLKMSERGAGYIHHPRSYDMEYYMQMFGEKLIITKNKKRVYQPVPGRRNETIDRYSYALAGLRMLKIDWATVELAGHIDHGRLVYKNHTMHNLNEGIVLLTAFPIIVCCDFKKNPLMWILAQTDGKRVTVFDEIAIQNGTTAQLAIEVLKRYGGHKKGFIVYGSATGTIRASGVKSEYEIMNDYGLGSPRRNPVRRIDPDSHMVVNTVNNMLENLAGESRLTYNSRCINLKRDFEQAIWVEDMSKVDDTDFGRGHAAQALGYFIEYEFPLSGPVAKTRNFLK